MAERDCLGGVLWHTVSELIHSTQVRLSVWESTFRRPAVPFHRYLVGLLDAEALAVDSTETEGREEVTLLSGDAEQLDPLFGVLGDAMSL